MATGKPNDEAGSKSEGLAPKVVSGTLILDQGFQFMLAMTPEEPLRWHPEVAATLTHDDGTTEAVRIKRTARAKRVKEGSELYVSGERDDDGATPPILSLTVTNFGEEIQIMESEAFAARAKVLKRKTRSKNSKSPKGRGQ